MSATTDAQAEAASAAALRPDAGAVRHYTVDERRTHGKETRAKVPRKLHSEWEPPAERRDPVELLEEQSATRIDELVPIRYGRMLESPLRFFRGAAALMAADLAELPRTGLDVQLCGDAHLANFGTYAAPDRRLVFDTNDFDETLPGPFEWDVKRLVTSFAVAGREREFNESHRREINRAVSRSYRKAMSRFAASRTLDVWYSRIDVDEFAAAWAPRVSAKRRAVYERNVEKARAKDSLAAFAKLTETVGGEPRFVSKPPLIIPVRELYSGDDMLERARLIIRSYRRTLQYDRRRLLERFRFVDAARKVVGVGSVGTRAWIVLFVGRDDEDPLILQIKEAEPSVLEKFLGASEFGNNGQRVVEGQRLMQAASDMMLGWFRTDGIDGVSRDFYVRQLWDSKGSAVIDLMSAKTMALYAQVCGHALARAHARSGDAVAIASYLGSGDRFDRALASFAETYADQNERDFAGLEKAVDAGLINARTGI
jgi:uncharacterized protein (DUF2252 family)